MFPGVVLPADVTDRGWWFHDWEGDRAMLQLAHHNAMSFVAQLVAHRTETGKRRIGTNKPYKKCFLSHANDAASRDMKFPQPLIQLCAVDFLYGIASQPYSLSCSAAQLRSGHQ